MSDLSNGASFFVTALVPIRLVWNQEANNANERDDNEWGDSVRTHQVGLHPITAPPKHAETFGKTFKTWVK